MKIGQSGEQVQQNEDLEKKKNRVSDWTEPGKGLYLLLRRLLWDLKVEDVQTINITVCTKPRSRYVSANTWCGQFVLKQVREQCMLFLSKKGWNHENNPKRLLDKGQRLFFTPYLAVAATTVNCHDFEHDWRYDTRHSNPLVMPFL